MISKKTFPKVIYVSHLPDGESGFWLNAQKTEAAAVEPIGQTFVAEYKLVKVRKRKTVVV